MNFKFSPYIAIPVKNNDKAVDFYKRVLGMEFKSAKGSETYLTKDGINFVFEDSPDNAFDAVFFEFKVESVLEARAMLVSEGCLILQVFSDKSVMVQDPYGMRFHIWEDGAFPDNP
jgi:catechol 2,3-dioxygenase-like lactoylglutathione lyase family enzyme